MWVGLRSEVTCQPPWTTRPRHNNLEFAPPRKGSHVTLGGAGTHRCHVDGGEGRRGGGGDGGRGCGGGGG
eukprot:8329912-Pyramimonas_sp.AAC.1